MAMGLLAASSATPWFNPTKAHSLSNSCSSWNSPNICIRSRFVRCSGTSSKSAEKSFVGQRRFEDKALPGTYWKDVPESDLGDKVLITFKKGPEKAQVSARSGENFLKVAEGCVMMVPDANFCFQGSCFYCEMKVAGGAQEVGSHGNSDIIRSCLCPILKGKSSIDVEVFDDGF